MCTEPNGIKGHRWPPRLKNAAFDRAGILVESFQWAQGTANMADGKLDPNMGKVWLQEFATATGLDVSKWVVKPWGYNIRFEELPDQESAERLVAFLKARYPVLPHVYFPLGHGYEVPVLRISSAGDAQVK